MLRTALFVFLAAAAGVILFTTIQDDLPDELSAFKNSGKYGAAQNSDALGGALPSKQVSHYKGWGVYADDTNVVLARKFTSSTPPEPKQKPAEAFFYYSCTNTGPELRLILAQAQSYPSSQTTAQVSWGPHSLSNWGLTDGRIVAPIPTYLLGALRANPLPISIAGTGGLPYAFSLDTEALSELTANLPVPCQL